MIFPSLIVHSILYLWKDVLFPFLLWWSLASVVLLVLVEFTHRLIPRNRVALRGAVWRMACILVLLLPVSYAASPLRYQVSILSPAAGVRSSGSDEPSNSMTPGPVNRPSTLDSAGLQTDPPPEWIDPDSHSMPILQSLKTTGQAPIPLFPNAQSASWSSFFLFLYVTGLAVIGFYFLLQRLAACRFLRTTQVCTSEALLSLVGQVTERLRIRKSIQVRISPTPCSPMLFARRKPVLVWPQFMLDSWTEEEWQPLITHELVHVRRRDRRYERVARFLRWLQWFAPTGYWLSSRLDETREAYSDIWAANSTLSPSFYVEQLLRIAEEVGNFNCRSAGVYPIKKGEKTLRRLQELLQRDPAQSVRMPWYLRLGVSLPFVLFFLLVGGFRWIAPAGINLSVAGVALQSDPQALEILQAYQKRSQEAHQGGYIVAWGRQQNYFTPEEEKRFQEQDSLGSLMYDRIVCVTEWVDIPLYRREMTDQSLYRPNLSLPELLENGQTEDVMWGRQIEIFTQAEHIVKRQDDPKRPMSVVKVNSREEEIRSSMQASEETLQRILQSQSLVISDITPIKYLYSCQLGTFEEIASMVQEGTWIASLRVEDETHTVTLQSDAAPTQIKWIVSKNSYPYPTRIELWNGPVLSETKDITYDSHRLPKTYTGISYDVDISSPETISMRPSIRFDLRFIEYKTGVSHDPALFQEENSLDDQAAITAEEYTPEEKEKALRQAEAVSLPLELEAGVDLSQEQQKVLQGHLWDARRLDYDFFNAAGKSGSPDSTLDLNKEKPEKITVRKTNNGYAGVLQGSVAKATYLYGPDRKEKGTPVCRQMKVSLPFLLPNPNQKPILQWERVKTEPWIEIQIQAYKSIAPRWDPIDADVKGRFVARQENGTYEHETVWKEKAGKKVTSRCELFNFADRSIGIRLESADPGMEVERPQDEEIPANSFVVISASALVPDASRQYQAHFTLNDRSMKDLILSMQMIPE